MTATTTTEPRDHGEVTVQIEAINRRLYDAIELHHRDDARALADQLAALAAELQRGLAAR